MESLEEINKEEYKPQTACVSCVFAECLDKTQVGCSLNRIEKFRDSGAEILEAYDETNQEFFIINGRNCSAKRPIQWLESIGGENKDRLFAQLAVLKELEIQYDAFLLANTANPVEVGDRVSMLQKQTLKPSNIVLVLDDSISVKSYISILKNSGFNWSIITIKEKDLLGGRVKKERAIDIALRDNISFKGKSRKSPYFLIIDEFQHGRLPRDFVKNIDTKLNIELEKFSIILTHDAKIMFGSRMLYQHLGGNGKHHTFLEKIQTLATEQKSEYMIKWINL